ncbi:MAG: SMC-Scp complex subunit ScpB [Patescibacteria group bacterium]
MQEETQKLALSMAIEAVLFKLNEPTSVKKICGILEKNETEILEGLKELKNSLNGRGLALLENNGEYSLVTAKQASEIIEKMVKDEMNRYLGKAGLETLSIVLYRGPLVRREIDYIRGVNSTFILRSLMIRGLVERVERGRQPLYRGTSQLLSFLGVSKIDELPEYGEVRKEIEKLNPEIAE